jgi:protein involved in sex pheromone biosynthesis
MKKLLLVVLTAFLLIITGCFAPGDHTPDDHSAKAQEIHKMPGRE